MRVLVTGASGFIGSALVDALDAAGFEVAPAVRDTARARRRWPRLDPLAVDFGTDLDPMVWQPRLRGIDAVVNTVGLFRETPQQSFESVHVRAPQALFAACVAGGVTRVVQLSALGADEQASTAYHRSKKQADAYLLSLPLNASVLQPSLVFGADGASTRLFLRLAALPLLPLPGGGRQRVQPVHVDDLVASVLAVLGAPSPPRRLAVVGPQPMRLRDYLQCLRRGLGLGRLRVLPLPAPIARLAAGLGSRLRRGPLDRDALAMLERGNTADAAPLSRLLGRPPRACAAFIDRSTRHALREAVLLRPALALLRLSIAALWIGTAIVSFGVYPVEQSYALLARSGVPPAFAPLALYGAATLDLALGLGMLARPTRLASYRLQIALILAYTLVITLRLPEFWLHPYAPMLKNLPVLAAIWLLLRLERR
jgi:uncharacterized protein YbjT (DUF2867 family)